MKNGVLRFYDLNFGLFIDLLVAFKKTGDCRDLLAIFAIGDFLDPSWAHVTIEDIFHFIRDLNCLDIRCRSSSRILSCYCTDRR